MNPRKSPRARDATEEVSALIATLHQTGQRLEELTAGEVDTVADHDGRTFLLRRAQEQLRHSEAAKQAAILNALPAHIALLDTQGLIISVNEAWRRFAGANAIQRPGYGIGLNYLEICDHASGDDASEAHQVAEGIRSVLGGGVKRFSIEYPCHSPTEQRWFLMTVTPLADDHPNGAVVMHLNITEQKRAKDELRESERRFSDMLGNVELVSLMLDREARITYCNDYLLRLTGWRHHEVIAKNWFELFEPPEISDMKVGFAALLANRPEASHHENEILTRSGERRLIRWNNSVLRSGGGDVIGTASIGEDITERRRYRESLRQNEERTRLIVESALDALVVMDATGRITDWNAQAEKTFGWSREQVIGLPVTETIIPTKYREAHKQGLRVFLETGQGPIVNKRIELSAMHRDGHEFPVELTISPVRLGGAWIFSSFIRDLSEHKKIEEEVRETKNFLASIFDNIPNSIVVKDAQDLRFVRVNAACEKLTGYPEKEFLGKSDYDFFPKDQADFFVAKDRETLAGKQRVFIVEETITSRDGTKKLLQTKKFPILDKDGHPQYLLAMSEDITERKQAEQSLQERAQIAALGADVGAALTRGETLVEMLQLCCEAIVGHLYAAFARIWTLNEREDMLELRASAGMYVHLDGPHGRVPVGKFKIGLIAQERKPHLTNQVVGDPRVGDQEWAKREGMVAFAGFPLLVEDHVVGVVAMFARNPLADVTLQGLASISNNIAVGIERKQAEASLRKSEERFRSFVEQSPDAMIIHQAGTIVFVNAAMVRLMRAGDTGTLLGKPGISLLQAGHAAIAEQRRAQLYSGQTVPLIDQVYVRSDGTTVEVEAAASPIVLDGKPAALVTVRDITDRRIQEQKISRLSRIHAVLSGINAAIVRIRDRRELFQEVCRIIVEHGHFTLGWIAVLDHATGKLMAVAQAGLTEKSAADSAFFNGSVGLVPAGTAEDALRQKHSAIDNVIEDKPGSTNAENEPDTMEIRRAAIGLGAKSVIVLPLVVEKETFGVLTLYAPERNFFDDEEIKLLNELASDIAFAIDHIDKQERLDYLAYYDELTRLANRSLFLDRVAQYTRSAVSGGHKLAVFLIDLERFKNINDSLGRPAGDALLRQVADWLTRNAGDANLVARVGADHFALVLPEVRQEGDVARSLEKTTKAFMEHPFRLNDAVFRIAVKVGVALFPDDGTNADTLFKNAEAALKKAKASGDRFLFYTQKMTETVAGKLTLENQLRQALDKEEFVLHYQPKVNLASGKLTGAEALIRWNDPRTGLVPPGRFIPILEETGMIFEVGRWALRKAIEDYLRWRTAGLTAVRIAVNVSPLQLRNAGFIAEIEQAIGIDAHAAAGLELEITESLIMEDIRHSIASLQAIRAMGVSIAIDDFGTGFSSLSYLAKLPVDTLKIDRSFVIDMTAAQEGLALVSTIINLAHSMKLKVVAEGVETEEQSRLLRLLNCDEMQGYLFSKPVPGEIFETRFLALP